ncbi:GntR family transcriptional regulator [Sutcliffiella horikoshii]|uniref:GntR family transcriptional regulator n=2 Tax=Sutcliffiella horikoshii TaxID=79883 RepID=A0A5D4T8A8_9BACI|nr:GntR family transcriptional regulator [Sutcliffiella horikoshii]TYS71131.1 GntR family transcriptional regulator [Sutcliffiella horikoshii]
MEIVSTQSMVNIAYTKIRENIIQANYMPGSLLSENELAENLGMSRTPIRSAISRLESEGYVSSLRNRGILVKEISFKEMMDILEVFRYLQEYSVEAVMEKNNTFNIEELEQYLKNQLEAEESNDYPRYVQYSLLFTRSMINASNNQLFVQIIDSVKDKLMQAAIVNWKLTPNQKHYSANLLNQSIFEAISKGNLSDIKQICKDNFFRSKESMIISGKI